MTGKKGDSLGADLGVLWYAGKHDLPAAADDYWDAYTNVPALTSPTCARGGGLGVDPGAAIDEFASRVSKALLDTRTALAAVGDALVWVADTYAATDTSCQSAFNRKKGALEAAGGQP